MGSAKDNIIQRIAAVRREAKAAISFDDISSFDHEVYKPVSPNAISCFKEELEAISGKCFISKSEKETFDQIKSYLHNQNIDQVYCRDKALQSVLATYSISYTDNTDDFYLMQAGITFCDFLIARTGSVIVSSFGDSGRQMNVFPPIHIIVATTDQLLNFPTDAMNEMKKKFGKELPSSITTITGPSRTADIEKTLVLGAHGPKELVVFLSEN